MHYIFGSWFDPFTHAHEAIIKSIKKKMRYGDKLHILVTDNDEKTNSTPVKARVEMVKTALESKCINYDIDIQKIRMYEYISWKFNKIPADQITIVIGEDECKTKMLTLKNMKNSEEKQMVYEEVLNYLCQQQQ